MRRDKVELGPLEDEELAGPNDSLIVTTSKRSLLGNWRAGGGGSNPVQNAAAGTPQKRGRGVFFNNGVGGGGEVGNFRLARAEESRPPPESVDFKQRLLVMLSSEEGARAIADKLYPKFEGDTRRLAAVQQLLEDKWAFPNRVFPLLWTQLRRVGDRTGNPDGAHVVTQEMWADAFVNWLHALQARLGQSKVTRQLLVQTRAGEDLSKVYLPGQKLGEGSYGEVYVALHASLGVARVMKMVPKAQLGLAEEQVQDEVNMLKALDHPHIVRIFEAYETEDRLHIVMDYAAGGDLAGVIRHAQEGPTALPEIWVKTVTLQITCALEYMHDRGVIHCDLKPGNTMLLSPPDFSNATVPHVLLADFGLAEIFEEHHGVSNGVKGTPAYLAPEGFEGRLTRKTDMWALGVMVFEMLLLRRPFKATSNIFMLYCDVANKSPPLDGMPELAQDLVKGLMTKDPNARFSGTECHHHGWLTETLDVPRLEEMDRAHMQGFGHAGYFQRTVMFMVAAGKGMADVAYLNRVWQFMDADRTGYLTLEQLHAGLQAMNLVQDPIALMAVMDLDQDQRISYTEFLAGAMRAEDHLSERTISYAFGLFDSDGDGQISMHDLRVMLTGDGTVTDVLPDGHTVEEVMDMVSGGADSISPGHFRDFLTKAKGEMSVANFKSGPAKSLHHVSSVLQELDESDIGPTKTQGILEEEELLQAQFPTFHRWLAGVFKETQHSASLKKVLVFEDHSLEAAYVAQYLPDTCLNIGLLAFLLCLYSLWTLMTESFAWSPTIDDWDGSALVVHNLAWLILCFSGLAVCGFSLWYWRTARFLAPDDEIEAKDDRLAVRYELVLGMWLALVPWVTCFCANRKRVAAVFNQDPLSLFGSMNDDFALIITMTGSMMFVETRTHIRFACTLPAAVSCVLAYLISTTSLGLEDPQCAYGNTTEADCDDSWWVWPFLLLATSTVLGLSGQWAIEYNRRLTFLSLYASYVVLRETEEANAADLVVENEGGDEAVGWSSGSRSARLKRVLKLIIRFSESANLGSRGLRNALISLVEMLQGVRDDVAQADQLLNIDVAELLSQRGVSGRPRDRLLCLFDAMPAPLPASPDLLAAEGHPGPQQAALGMTARLGAWQWDAFQNPDRLSQPARLRPLFQLGEALVIPAAEAAAAEACQDEEGPAVNAAMGAARTRAYGFLESIQGQLASCTPDAEARATLTLRSAHWLAQCLGIWDAAAAWERLALLLAACSLHCAGAGCGSLVGDPLLTRMASSCRAMQILESSGLTMGASGPRLWRLVKRLLTRARPRCMLDDARRVRSQHDKDDLLVTEPSERATLLGLVLGAADFAFLAQPPALHRKWAMAIKQQADLEPPLILRGIPGDEEEGFDIGCFLRGLVESLALPVYETLQGLDVKGRRLKEATGYLQDNARHWRVQPLLLEPKLGQITAGQGQIERLLDDLAVPGTRSQGQGDQSRSSRGGEHPLGIGSVGGAAGTGSVGGIGLPGAAESIALRRTASGANSTLARQPPQVPDDRDPTASMSRFHPDSTESTWPGEDGTLRHDPSSMRMYTLQHTASEVATMGPVGPGLDGRLYQEDCSMQMAILEAASDVATLAQDPRRCDTLPHLEDSGIMMLDLSAGDAATLMAPGEPGVASERRAHFYDDRSLQMSVLAEASEAGTSSRQMGTLRGDMTLADNRTMQASVCTRSSAMATTMNRSFAPGNDQRAMRGHSFTALPEEAATICLPNPDAGPVLSQCPSEDAATGAPPCELPGAMPTVE